MPKIDAKKPVAKPAAKPAAKSETNGEGKPREVLYPKQQVIVYHGDGTIPVELIVRPAMTAEKMRQWLGWMTETEYTKFRLSVDPTLKEEEATFPKNGIVPIIDEHGEPVLDHSGKPSVTRVLLTDENGERVICLNNCSNRSFDEGLSRKLCQDIINRNWAGPTTMPEETFNGETGIIGRTGQVISLQHRGVALILAEQIWRKQLKDGGGHATEMWPPEQWPNGPVMDIPLFVGVSEHSKVMRTVDNVRPRSLADVIETSPFFAGLNPEQKRDCAKMMDAAVDLLWQRTGAGKGGTAEQNAHRLQTHSESLDFMERHDKLKKCVEHVRRCNKDRAISLMKLNAGHCAAIMYMMATSESDIDDYIQADPLPCEKVLSFKRWELAKGFWTDIKEGEGNSDLIREVMAELVDVDGGRASEKICVLAKAWNAMIDPSSGGRLVKSDLSLEDCCLTDENGQRRLGPNAPGFGGIDLGPKTGRAEVSEKEAAAAKSEIDAERKAKQEQLQKEAEEKLARHNAAKNSSGIMDWVPPKSAGNKSVAAPSEGVPAKPSAPASQLGGGKPPQPVIPAVSKPSAAGKTTKPSKPPASGLRGGTGR